MRRGTAVISVVAVLFTLLGCARIGTSGPVVSGGPAGKPAGLQALVPGPGPGDSPEQIVQGFMRAGLSARSEYEAARLFLTTERATDWRPSQQTLVYSDEVKLSGFADNPQAPAGDEPTTSSGIVSVQVVATIDATGHLLHDRTDRRQHGHACTRLPIRVAKLTLEPWPEGESRLQRAARCHEAGPVWPSRADDSRARAPRRRPAWPT